MAGRLAAVVGLVPGRRSRGPTGSARGSGGTRREALGRGQTCAGRAARVPEGDQRLDPRGASARPSSGSSSARCHGAAQRVPRHGEARVADARARKRGSLNMSGFWSPMPMISARAGARAPRGGEQRRRRAATGASRRRRHAPASCRREDGVLVGVRRRAAAQEHERLGALVDQLVDGARRDDRAVPRRDVALGLAHPQATAAGGEEVELLGARGGSARPSGAPGGTLASARLWLRAGVQAGPTSSRMVEPSRVVNGSRSSRREMHDGRLPPRGALDRAAAGKVAGASRVDVATA